MRGPRYSHGPVPYGWDINYHKRLVPSRRAAGGSGHTEAAVAADVFARIAAGSFPYREAKRLNDAGVPAVERYARNADPHAVGRWRPSRLAKMVRNPLYRLLVGDETWERANATLDARRVASGATLDYPLTGAVSCACGAPYVGHAQRGPQGSKRRYYVCAAAHAPASYADRRCRARSIPAEWIEQEVAPFGPTARVRVEQATSGGRETALVSIETPDGPPVPRLYPYSARRREG